MRKLKRNFVLTLSGTNLLMPFVSVLYSIIPVVSYVRGIKFFFFSNEGDPREPLHIHVRKDEKLAKFWLFPEVKAAESFGFSSRELNVLAKILETRRIEIEEAWHEYFGT